MVTMVKVVVKIVVKPKWIDRIIGWWIGIVVSSVTRPHLFIQLGGFQKIINDRLADLGLLQLIHFLAGQPVKFSSQRSCAVTGPCRIK